MKIDRLKLLAKIIHEQNPFLMKEIISGLIEALEDDDGLKTKVMDDLKAKVMHLERELDKKEHILHMFEKLTTPRDGKCASCLGACCFSHEEIELLPEDIEQLRRVLSPEYFSVYEWGWGRFNLRRYTLPGGQIVNACPLLDTDGHCTIYADRPRICRDYHSGNCCVYRPRKEVEKGP